jgi:hypothetical protein
MVAEATTINQPNQRWSFFFVRPHPALKILRQPKWLYKRALRLEYLEEERTDWGDIFISLKQQNSNNIPQTDPSERGPMCHGWLLWQAVLDLFDWL